MPDTAKPQSRYSWMQEALSAGEKKFHEAIDRIKNAEVGGGELSLADFNASESEATAVVKSLQVKLRTESDKEEIAKLLKSAPYGIKEMLVNNFKNGVVKKIQEREPGFFGKQIH